MIKFKQNSIALTKFVKETFVVNLLCVVIGVINFHGRLPCSMDCALCLLSCLLISCNVGTLGTLLNCCIPPEKYFFLFFIFIKKFYFKILFKNFISKFYSKILKNFFFQILRILPLNLE